MTPTHAILPAPTKGRHYLARPTGERWLPLPSPTPTGPLPGGWWRRSDYPGGPLAWDRASALPTLAARLVAAMLDAAPPAAGRPPAPAPEGGDGALVEAAQRAGGYRTRGALAAAVGIAATQLSRARAGAPLPGWCRARLESVRETGRAEEGWRRGGPASSASRG